MEPESSRLRHDEGAEHEALVSAEAPRTTRRYEGVEELLREDAARVEVPPRIAARLIRSLRAEWGGRSWLRRFFSR